MGTDWQERMENILICVVAGSAQTLRDSQLIVVDEAIWTIAEKRLKARKRGTARK